MDSVSGACASKTWRLVRLDERVAVFGVSTGWRSLALVLRVLVVIVGVSTISKLLSNVRTLQALDVALGFAFSLLFGCVFFVDTKGESSSSLISIAWQAFRST